MQRTWEGPTAPILVVSMTTDPGAFGRNCKRSLLMNSVELITVILMWFVTPNSMVYCSLKLVLLEGGGPLGGGRAPPGMGPQTAL